MDDNWNPPKTINILSMFNTAVRFVGILVMLAGIGFGFSVVREGWALFEDPTLVTSFSENLEKESDINKSVNSILNSFLFELQRANNNIESIQDSVNADNKQQQPKNQPQKIHPLNASYFISWSLKILLLIILAKIALWLISTGGNMASKDTTNKELVSGIAKEICSDIFTELDRRSGNRTL